MYRELCSEYYLVPFADLILNRDMEIGEGGADHDEVLLLAFEAGCLAVRGAHARAIIVSALYAKLTASRRSAKLTWSRSSPLAERITVGKSKISYV